MGASLERNTIIKGRYVVDMLSPTQHNGYITYYCTDKQTDSRVMLKEFFPEYATRDSSGNLQYSLNQEKDMNDFNESHQLARKFGTLPTVVAVYDIFTENNTLYAVCEFVQGRLVSKLWAKGSGFTFSSVQRVIVNLLRTNEAIGRFGMFHADFNPENIIITNDGCVKINKFIPIAQPQAERDAIKSVASLGYFMLSGGTLSKTKPAPKVSGASNVKRLAAYLKYVYLNDNIVVTTSKILEDSERNFDVKLSANFANKHTGQVRSSVDVPVRKGSQGASKPKMSTKKKLLAIGIPVLAFLTIIATILIFTGGTEIENADVTSIKYSIDGSAYTELSFQEPVGFPGIESLKRDFSEIKVDNIGKSTAAFYLDIEADSSCQLTVKHNGFDAAKCKQEDGKYKLDTTGIDDGKIVITSTRSKICKSTYTISYTRKTLAKLDNIRYSVDSGAFVPVEDFDKDKTDSNINPPETAKTVTIEFVKGSGLERTFTVDNKIQSDGVIDVTPGEQPRTIKVDVTVTDPSGQKEPNTYTVNINVSDNSKIKAEKLAAEKAKEEENKKKSTKKAQEDAAKKAQEDAAKKAQEDAAKKAQEDAAKKAQEDAAKKAQEDAAKKAQEDAAKKVQEEKKVTIPNVVGKTEEEACNAIRKADSTAGINVTTAPSTTVSAGKVIKQTVIGETKPGASVTITVSIGYIIVPNVIGKTEANARNEILNVGGKVVVRTENSDKVEKGLVISQSIAGGTKANSGETVVITVSQGQ